METNTQAQNEISLGDIFRIILKKIKVVLLALLGGILLGVVIGISSTANVDYYGTSSEFYVNPVKKVSDEKDETYNVYGAYSKYIMDNMIKLLSSDIFAEKIALGAGELPPTGINDAVDEKIAEANEAITAWQEATSETKAEALKAKNTAVKNAVLEWRKTNHYKALVSRIKASVSYTYYKGEQSNVDSMAKSFIYVSISVLNDAKFATTLYERIKLVLPEYVMEYMPNPDPSVYDSTNCVLISTLANVGHLNPTAEKDAIVKNGIIFGAIAFVLACIVVVVVTVSDKRLVNYEVTMEKFGVPVLGVIPTIEMSAKKTNDGGEENESL
jgi:capsular polysaccharide biosynthesis protein